MTGLLEPLHMLEMSKEFKSGHSPSQSAVKVVDALNPTSRASDGKTSNLKVKTLLPPASSIHSLCISECVHPPPQPRKPANY